MIAKYFYRQGQESEGHWVSISDVMTVLMVIFLFVAISYMFNIHQKTSKIIEHEETIQTLLSDYENLKDKLAKELQFEFQGDPDKQKQFESNWEGYLNMDTLTIGFKHPFKIGSRIVPEDFKNLLTDFFPRYIAILIQPDYKAKIEEIRIEGHTSSEWQDQGADVAFIKNMELSQNRARNVLDYVLEIDNRQISENKIWLKKKVTANGLSSSHLILNFVENIRPEPTNSYPTIAAETKIKASVVQPLHQYLLREISNWQTNQELDKSEIIKRSNDYFKVKIGPEVVERVISLLLEDKEVSRRVEFRVVTKSEKVLEDLKQLFENFNQSTRRNESF